jgi:hypothetical protein
MPFNLQLVGCMTTSISSHFLTRDEYRIKRGAKRARFTYSVSQESTTYDQVKRRTTYKNRFKSSHPAPERNGANSIERKMALHRGCTIRRQARSGHEDASWILDCQASRPSATSAKQTYRFRFRVAIFRIFPADASFTRLQLSDRF